MKPASFALALARGSDERLFSLSTTGRVLSWTRVAEVLLGFDRADVVGRPLISLAVAPEDVDRFQEALRAAATAGTATCRMRLRGRDGTLLDEPLPLKLARDAGGGDSIAILVGRERAEPRVVEAPLVPITTQADDASPRDRLAQEIDRALGASFDAVAMSRRLCRLLAPALVDWCAVDLANANGTIRRVAAVHRDASLEAAVMRAGDEANEPDAPASAHLAHRLGRILTEAEFPLPPPTAGDSPRLAALREAGLSSYLCIPLVGRLRPGGVLTLALGRSDRAFTPEDGAWMREIARRFALELENARLADVVQRSREEARVANERANLLQALAAAVSEALTPGEVTQVVVDQCKKALGACGGSIAALRDASFELIGSVGPAEALSNAWRHFPLHSRLPLADAGRSGEIVLVEHLPAAAARYPHLSSGVQGVGAVAAVALVVDGRRTGALGLTFPERRTFSDSDVAFMRTIARVAADALERARLYDAERSARARASVEASRSGLLSEASRMLAESFEYEKTLQDVARLLVPSIADWCAIHVQEEGGALRTVALVHADPLKAPLVERLRSIAPDRDGLPIAKALESRQPQIFHNIPVEAMHAFVPNPERRTLAQELGLRSMMVLPLASRSRILGVLMLAHGGIRRFQSGDLPLAEELARRIAMGLDNARLFREAQESEERYRLLVEGVQDHAFFMLDEDGRVASWNAGAQRLLGHETGDVVGAHIDIVYPPEEREAGHATRHLDEARALGRYEEEGVRVRRDGSAFVAFTVLTALRDPAGALRGFSLLVRDVTEQRRSREALDHLRQQVVVSEKLSTMGTLVSGVAHEIRTPLTAMANSLYGLRFRLEAAKGKAMDEGTFAAMQARLDVALEGIDRVNHLVEDLRRFHRLPAASRTTVGLHKVVEEALNLFQAAHRGVVEIEARIQPTPPCEVDRVQIQQAVLNLLQNAAEAMPHGGRVVLETRSEAGRAVIVVKDNGAGMPPDVRARMFEEFFTTKRDGTGLGLSIVRRIAEAHGASIDCESDVGKGTQFSLRFPPAA